MKTWAKMSEVCNEGAGGRWRFHSLPGLAEQRVPHGVARDRKESSLSAGGEKSPGVQGLVRVRVLQEDLFHIFH